MRLINRYYALWSIIISLLVWLFLIGTMTGGAQAAATPINVGENKTGSLDDTSSSVQYTLTVNTPQSISIQVLAITAGLAPTFTLLDPSGVMILDTTSAATANIARATATLSDAGAYTIAVKSATATAGQFLISIEAGSPLAAPTALTLGTPVSGSVNPQTPRQAYSFSGDSAAALLLTVSMDDPATGAVIALRDADTHEMLSLSSARLGGIRYRILSGQANYLLEVSHSGASAAEAFSICLATESGSTSCPDGSTGTTVVEATIASTMLAGVPSQTPTFAPVAINPAGVCQVTPARNNSINVRSGAGTNFNIVGQIASNGTGLVVGRLADNSWFQINVNGTLGWVSAGVVILGGSCSGVTVIVLPTAIPPTNAPPVSVPNNPSNNSSTQAPTEAPPVNGPRLDPRANPVSYPVQPLSEADLASGGAYHYGITAGGNVDPTYLGSACMGSVTAAPNMRIAYSGNGASLLRFYFVGDDPQGDDGSLIVQDPDGHFHCNDDSYGTKDPTININNALSGDYNIWIGTFRVEVPVNGALYVTSDEGSHP